MGGLERRLGRLEERFPPPREPADPEDLPVEEWVEEEMRGYAWTSLYGIDGDEEQYERWYEGRLVGLLYRVGDRAREGGFRLEEPVSGETAEAIARRVRDALEPHALYWRERFDEAAPQRERKREMHREWLEGRGR